MLENYTFVIPARRNSKGLPFKNRILIEDTLSKIPNRFKNKIIIATDDEFIKQNYSDYKIFHRSKSVSHDQASTKSLFEEMSPYITTSEIVMLYVTYPERTFKDVLSAISFYEKHSATSLLCSKKTNLSPYLMMFKSGIQGRQVISHDLFRRQDYPECFEISHYISIFNKNNINNLNNNLYNKTTIFQSMKQLMLILRRI
jgi:CMP-N-acetylneuraminic acid synthetase